MFTMGGDKPFTEQTLYEEICKIWGAHGAHADVYVEICKRADIQLTGYNGQIVDEPIEAKIKRIYGEENGSKLQTIKRVRLETAMSLLEAKRLVESIVE